MRNPSSSWLGISLGLSMAACANVPMSPPTRTLPASGATPAASEAGGWSASAPATGEPVLYSRDGTPVERGTRSSGMSGADAGLPPRGIQTEGAASRPYMLELYQSAVQRGDDLAIEVESLESMLVDSENREAELAAEVARLEQLVGGLTEERDRIQSQSFELAERLTTAQIRRLEAEKLLLETVLQNEQQARRDSELLEATGSTGAPVRAGTGTGTGTGATSVPTSTSGDPSGRPHFAQRPAGQGGSR